MVAAEKKSLDSERVSDRVWARAWSWVWGSGMSVAQERDSFQR